jgi:hypothetical protein
MKTLTHNWIRFWIGYIAMFMILCMADVKTGLFFYGPIGIMHGMLIGYIIYPNMNDKKLYIPYYLYYIWTFANCLLFIYL